MAYTIMDHNGSKVVREGKELFGADHLELDVKLLNPDSRVVQVVVSSDRTDRDGDRINQRGIIYDHHIKNPVVLYAHDWGQRYLPIAKLLDFSVQEREGCTVTVERHQFNPPGAYELSDAAWKLVEFGSLVATSIGFIPLTITNPQGEAERTELGLGRFGVYYDKVEKIETSWVPLPSNRDAIREAYGKGIINRTDARILFPNTWDEINARQSWPGADLGPGMKGAIPYERHPLADEDVAWDGPREVAAAEVKDLKVMCAWYDSENPDLKSSYKLPHHRASDYHTVWRGVAAAMAALMGSRGGVDIPDSDRRAVYNHLAKHYKDFDREPPEFDSLSLIDGTGSSPPEGEVELLDLLIQAGRDLLKDIRRRGRWVGRVGGITNTEAR